MNDTAQPSDSFSSEIISTINTLQKLVENEELLCQLTKEQRINLMNFAGRLTRPDRADKKKRNQAKNKLLRQKIVRDEKNIRVKTGIRAARKASVFTSPEQISYADIDVSVQRVLHSPRNCYVCKKEYTEIHFFYDALCPACAEFNYKKRFQTAPLHGQIALITGSRLKIGYQATLMMLPAGVQLLLRTYKNCLSQLDSSISGTLSGDNMTGNTNYALSSTWNEKMPGIGLRSSAKLSMAAYAHDSSLSAEKIFPPGKLDADLQQVDLRTTNSWRLQMGDIDTSEMMEIQLINAIAPFVLCNRLTPMMKRHNTGQKHIVNVSAMEGKFFRFTKDSRHPHTNMAKAALNMLTHTSAGELAKSGIYINAVDTGWVTDEDPVTLVKYKMEKHDFQPPLDIVDGAARVCDPFFDCINTGKHWCGKFLKDYFPIDW